MIANNIIQSGLVAVLLNCVILWGQLTANANLSSVEYLLKIRQSARTRAFN